MPLQVKELAQIRIWINQLNLDQNNLINNSMQDHKRVFLAAEVACLGLISIIQVSKLSHSL